MSQTEYATIPVHPLPTIYETTLAVVEKEQGEDRFVDHVVIDDIIGPAEHPVSGTDLTPEVEAEDEQE